MGNIFYQVLCIVYIILYNKCNFINVIGGYIFSHPRGLIQDMAFIVTLAAAV